MSLKFRGNYRKLKKAVVQTGLIGSWRALKYGQKQYRTDDGGVLNWWRRPGQFRFKVQKRQLRRSWRRRSLPPRKSDLLGYTVGKCFALDCGACIPNLIYAEAKKYFSHAEVLLELPFAASHDDLLRVAVSVFQICK
jgi:hypothetical protein